MEGKNNNKTDMVILMGCILLLFLGCLAFFPPAGISRNSGIRALIPFCILSFPK